MKSREELNALKEKFEEMNQKLSELTENELAQIFGGFGPTPTPSPSPDPGPTPSGSIVGRAQHELGKPYAWGTAGPATYDCSGLVSYCLTGVHTRIGTCETFMKWPRVSDPQPGDICVSAYHCGIYTGPNSMIHAPTFGAVVSYGTIQSDMIIVRYPGA